MVYCPGFHPTMTPDAGSDHPLGLQTLWLQINPKAVYTKRGWGFVGDILDIYLHAVNMSIHCSSQ